VGNVQRARRSLGEVSEKTVGGWVESEEWRGAQRYPVWYISGLGRVQKRGQDNGAKGKQTKNLASGSIRGMGSGPGGPVVGLSNIPSTPVEGPYLTW